MSEHNAHNYVSLNGKVVLRSDAHISIDDRGFRYGDGVFETMRITNSKIFQEHFHIARLQKGADAISIPINASNIIANAHTIIDKNTITEGLMRIAVTRGPGGRGYAPPAIARPTIFIESMSLPEAPATAASLHISHYRKIPKQCLPIGHKLAQGLSSTLARSEALAAGHDEALMLTINNHISESSSGNIFWIIGDTLFTPSLNCDCVDGSMRHLVMSFPDMPAQETAANIEVLDNADAIFLTNIAWPLWAVKHIDRFNKTYDVGKVTPITAWVMEQIRHG